ncbi:metal ABC transporter solute-binding protein, Zn/Mn family [Breznakiellaceae bacterium SP9]
MIKRSIAFRVVLFFTPYLLFSGASSEQTFSTIVVVSILPQAWFIEQIAGDRVKTQVLIGPGQSPHTYELRPHQLADLGQASFWLLSGAEFELSLVPKVRQLFPKLLIIDGTQGVQLRLLEAHEDDGDGHAAIEYDRHTWLGRKPAKIMAAHIRDAFSSLYRERQKVYHDTCAKVLAQIDAVFDRLQTELKPLYGQTVFVYHPSFGYFLDEFGIKQEAVETGGKEPSARQLRALIEHAKSAGAAAIFVQAQFPVNTAQTVAQATGAQLIPLDPLAPDWLDTIERIGRALKQTIHP